MPLPFSNDNKRQYICFVCGLAFKHDEIELYKDHIIENHEECREYILCPVSHCAMPVRDLPLHYKCCHKETPIPKNMQMRVMVWKDQGTKKRKKLRFNEGFHVSLKTGKSMHYRSSWEKQIYECLDKMDDVISYIVEPFYISYFWAGKMRKYYPDILIEYSDRKVLVECKPSSQTASEQNRAKWAAASQYCLSMGMTFEVLTEKGITKMILEANGGSIS